MRLWVIALLLLAPAASAAPVDVYMHLNGLQDMPANTQQPEGEHVARAGTMSHSACLDAPGSSAYNQELHTWYAYGSPSRVDYDWNGDGTPRFVPERGVGRDVLIDPDLQPVLTWHLAATGPTEDADGLVHAIPDVVVRVQVRAADDLSVGHRALDEGQLVASGKTGPVTLHPAVDHEAVTPHEVGDLQVYAFQVSLELHNTTISENDGYNIRIDAMMDNAMCSGDDGYIMPDLVSPYQGSGLWNHLRIGVLNPLLLDYMHLQVIQEDLVVHTSLTSPFGGDDVQTKDLELAGPGSLAAERIDVSRVHEHDSREMFEHEPAWLIETAGAEPGLYTMRLQASNLQGTANVTVTATFEVGDHSLRVCQDRGAGHECVTHPTGNVEVPAASGIWALALLVLLRRR